MSVLRSSRPDFGLVIIVKCIFFLLQNIVPAISHKKLAKRCKGISTAAVSPNGRFVVFGTVHGKNHIIFKYNVIF